MNRSSSNSVVVSVISSPPRVTSWLSSSSTRSPTTIFEPLFWLGPPRRGARPPLPGAERLRDVVVAPRRQTGDAVLHRVFGGQQQQRQTGNLVAELAQHVKAAHVRKHHVEHHHVGWLLAC